MKKILSILALLLALPFLSACSAPPPPPAAPAPAAAGNAKIALLVHSDVELALADELAKFTQDLNVGGYDVVIQLPVSADASPADLRQDLHDLWGNDGIVGAILIGAVPAPVFEKTVKDNVEAEPVDYYYMELDGDWADNKILDMENTGRLDYLGDGDGDRGPEIWIGRIDASTLAPPVTVAPEDAEVYYLKKYFDKNHAFRNDEYETNGKALIYNAIYDTGESDHPALAYTNANLNVISAKKEQIVSKAGYLGYLDIPYEWLVSVNHSMSNEHSFPQFYPNGDEILTSSELRNIPQALFVSLKACHAADFTADDYIAGYYLFDDSAGLALIGVPGVTKPMNDSPLFRSLSGWGLKQADDGSDFADVFEYFPPKNLGDAYLDMLNHFFYDTTSEGELTPNAYDHLFPVLLGDPTLKPPSIVAAQEPAATQGPALDWGGQWGAYPEKNALEIKPVSNLARLDNASADDPRELVVWLTNNGDDEAEIDKFTYQITGTDMDGSTVTLMGNALPVYPYAPSSQPFIDPGLSEAYILDKYHELDPNEKVTTTITINYHGKEITTPKGFFGTFEAEPAGNLVPETAKFSAYTGDFLFALHNNAAAAINVPDGGIDVALDVSLNNVNIGTIQEFAKVWDGIVFSNARIGKHVLCDNSLFVPRSAFTDLGAQSGDSLKIDITIDPSEPGSSDEVLSVDLTLP